MERYGRKTRELTDEHTGRFILESWWNSKLKFTKALAHEQQYWLTWHSLPVHNHRREADLQSFVNTRWADQNKQHWRHGAIKLGGRGPNRVCFLTNTSPQEDPGLPMEAAGSTLGRKRTKCTAPGPSLPARRSSESDGPHPRTWNPAEEPHWQNLRQCEQKNKDSNVLQPKDPNESTWAATVWILNVLQDPSVKGLKPRVVRPRGGRAFMRWDLLGASVQQVCPQRGARDWFLLSLSLISCHEVSGSVPPHAPTVHYSKLKAMGPTNHRPKPLKLFSLISW